MFSMQKGTIYPDVIESSSVPGASQTIKSHHNVGGLPKDMKLKVVEPLRLLFKDEVRRVGKVLGLDPNILWRHPFPGPGLGIRVLGEVTAEKIAIVQEADKIFIDALKRWNLYDKVWQAGAILLPIKSVGVMGDERSYENTIALRTVNSVDGMTAAGIPYYQMTEEQILECIRQYADTAENAVKSGFEKIILHAGHALRFSRRSLRCHHPWRQRGEQSGLRYQFKAAGNY